MRLLLRCGGGSAGKRYIRIKSLRINAVDLAFVNGIGAGSTFENRMMKVITIGIPGIPYIPYEFFGEYTLTDL